jgi:hypothetical protein
MSDSVETDWTDRQISDYRVLHRLGRGGMSDVYLAFHEKLRRHVALKVLRSSLTVSPEHRVRFLREAQAAAGLIHPNIVQVFDVGSLGQTDYIVQEYIAGCNLSTYLKRRGPLPSEEAVSILMQAAAALTRSARQGIVHRDIKPENILLTADGEAKVADFGLARGGGQENNLTEIGVTLGTPLYMSPEQIQGLAVDTRSDLYSLGVTAFHMLAGRPPFEGDTPLQLAVQHMQVPPPALDSLRPDLPAELCRMVHALLEKDPDARLQTPQELLQRLQRIADELSASPNLAGSLGDVPVRLPLATQTDDGVPVSTYTERLQAVIDRRISRQRAWRRWSVVGSLMGLLAATTAGWAAVRFGGRGGILPPLVERLGIPKQQTVQRQYFEALMRDSVADWRAVESYFPPTEDPEALAYNLRAWLRLSAAARRQGSFGLARQALEKLKTQAVVSGAARNLYTALAWVEQAKLAIAENRAAEAGREAASTSLRQAASLYLELGVEEQDLIEQAIAPLQDLWDDALKAEA